MSNTTVWPNIAISYHCQPTIHREFKDVEEFKEEVGRLFEKAKKK